ncbi:aldo/keto reductase [Microcoleus sp. FACHB-831]|uniref:aldo/keto reductase n=1 Tax=Microcoleus sp. FACHB-831 TaxID=2692827 RepID=UPI001684B39E|nr:aldo/keto reductase [Microcoleus sp. FACHB-831]MBD1920221.1 aldo/keto reductase [Microcoleus sp. FACHB-831]
METRSLGNSGIQITPIIMGTWQAGKKMWVGIEDSDTIKAIRAAVDAGITTIDTAEVYGDGHSEQIVADALSDIRDKVVYATKVFANHLKYDQVIEACDRSLKNLKTDYIDLYQIHWPSGTFKTELVPIEETMKALNYLQRQGKIRAIGVSNFNRAQLEEASQYGRIDSLQPPYSLFWRWVEKEAMSYCVDNKISIIAYSPLAQGLLTGKFQPGHKFDPADNRAKNKLFQGENYQRAQEALNQLRPIAERHDCTLAQLALAWLIAQPQANAIAGARNAQQAVDNAKAGDVKLSVDELKEIDAIGRTVTDSIDDNPVMWDWN